MKVSTKWLKTLRPSHATLGVTGAVCSNFREGLHNLVKCPLDINHGFRMHSPHDIAIHSRTVLIAHCFHSGLGLLVVPALLPKPIGQAAPWSG